MQVATCEKFEHLRVFMGKERLTEIQFLGWKSNGDGFAESCNLGCTLFGCVEEEQYRMDRRKKFLRVIHEDK